MPKNTCGTWPTRSLDAAQPRERSGPHTPARSSNRGRVKLSSARSRCCRPSRRNQGKHAVFPSGPWTTLPPTPPACAIPSSALKVCTLAVASPRPPAKPLSAPVPNALACAGLLSALMLSCLCVPPFSTEPTTRSGSKNMPPDCLQRIHTPAALGLHFTPGYFCAKMGQKWLIFRKEEYLPPLPFTVSILEQAHRSALQGLFCFTTLPPCISCVAIAAS